MLIIKSIQETAFLNKSSLHLRTSVSYRSCMKIPEKNSHWSLLSFQWRETQSFVLSVSRARHTVEEGSRLALLFEHVDCSRDWGYAIGCVQNRGYSHYASIIDLIAATVPLPWEYKLHSQQLMFVYRYCCQCCRRGKCAFWRASWCIQGERNWEKKSLWHSNEMRFYHIGLYWGRRSVKIFSKSPP